MSILSDIMKAWRRPAPPTQSEIDAHLAHLDSLSLAFQDVAGLADALDLHKLVEDELRWFGKHHIKLSRRADMTHSVESQPDKQ